MTGVLISEALILVFVDQRFVKHFFCMICEYLFLISAPGVFLQGWEEYIQKEYLFHCAIGMKKTKMPVYMLWTDKLPLFFLWACGCFGALDGSGKRVLMILMHAIYMIMLLFASELVFINYKAKRIYAGAWILLVGTCITDFGCQLYFLQNKQGELRRVMSEYTSISLFIQGRGNCIGFGIALMLIICSICLCKIHHTKKLMEVAAGENFGRINCSFKAWKYSRILEDVFNHKMDLLAIIFLYLFAGVYGFMGFEDHESEMLLGVMILAICLSAIPMLYHWDRQILLNLKLWGMSGKQFLTEKIQHSIWMIFFPSVVVICKLFVHGSTGSGLMILLFVIQSVLFWNAMYFAVMCVMPISYCIWDYLLMGLCLLVSFIPFVPLGMSFFIINKGLKNWCRYAEGI